MSCERTVQLNGHEVRMRASALIPRLYRYKFGRDVIIDMNKLAKNFAKCKDNDEQLSILDLETFENIAWLMMKHAGEEVGETPDEWLETLDGVFSVYEILPTILELWSANQQTTAIPVKK